MQLNLSVLNSINCSQTESNEVLNTFTSTGQGSCCSPCQHFASGDQGHDVHLILHPWGALQRFSSARSLAWCLTPCYLVVYAFVCAAASATASIGWLSLLQPRQSFTPQSLLPEPCTFRRCLPRSVGNCVKRVVIIVASVLVFANPMTAQSVAGTTLALSGVLAYTFAGRKAKTA